MPAPTYDEINARTEELRALDKGGRISKAYHTSNVEDAADAVRRFITAQNLDPDTLIVRIEVIGTSPTPTHVLRQQALESFRKP